MFNTDSEINILVESLKNSGNVDGVLESLYYVLEHHTPFGLYVATADRSNCMWIFDPPTLYEMLGGQDIHDKTFRSVFTNDIERSQGILFYVLKKVGPVAVVRLSHSTIKDVIDVLEMSKT